MKIISLEKTVKSTASDYCTGSSKDFDDFFPHRMGDMLSAKNHQNLLKNQHINHSRYNLTAFSRINKFFYTFLFLWTSLAFSDNCCMQMGGASYCDSSAGRLVCKNGFYSACYCERHAIMDLQLLKGCCLWQGGVSPTLDTTGLVLCNDGTISEECSIGSAYNPAGTF